MHRPTFFHPLVLREIPMKRLALLLSAAALLGAVPSAAQRCSARVERMRPADSVRVAAERQFTRDLRDAVIAELRQAGHTEPRGLVVVDVGSRRTGPAQVHAFATPEVDAAVRGLLAGRTAELAAWPGREGAFHFRLDPDPPAREGARECPPSLLNPGAATREITRVLTRVAATEPGLFSPGAPRVRVSARMLVDRAGEVVFATLNRRSNRDRVDDAILDLARRQRFRPATVDGAPIDVWVELPFDLTSP